MQDAVTTIGVTGAAARSQTSERLRLIARNIFPFVVVGTIWEIVAWAGVFPHRLFPTLEEVAASFVRLTVAGILPHHAIETVIRLLSGFGLAAISGVTIGVLMGRSRRAEDIFLPLVSICAPIPGLAYAPLFLLWFGLGNVSAVLLVGFVSAFPIIFNSWTGVKAVKEIWVRSAQSMGADDRRMFSHVILPGALPYILTGLRLGLAQAWRILVAVEMLAAVPWGLGWLIFGAREFLAIAAAIYDTLARSGHFAPALLPTIPAVAKTLFAMIADGTIIEHAAFTMYRVMFGFSLAVVVGIPLGILMARFSAIENFFLPLISALMPIPSFALVPLFMLWFGIGNLTTILIVFYAATFPMVFNTWSGVRSVNPLWLRAAGAMGADENSLFWKVIIPGASPFIITGMRQAFLRAWIAVVGAEMIAASDWGLGWVIFDAKEFLNADIMLASLAVIGAIGYAFERLVFGSIERATVQRWGMVRLAKG